MPLPDNGWTEKQAQALFERLNLDGGTPKWKREHLHRLRSWCSARGKDSATIDGQLEFVAADLCDTYEGVGMALMRAMTVEEARAAVAPYINRITATDTLPSVKSLRDGEADMLHFGTLQTLLTPPSRSLPPTATRTSSASARDVASSD
jgi:hypothetical protein